MTEVFFIYFFQLILMSILFILPYGTSETLKERKKRIMKLSYKKKVKLRKTDLSHFTSNLTSKKSIECISGTANSDSYSLIFIV